MFTKIELYLSSAIKDAEDFLKDNPVKTDKIGNFLIEQAIDKKNNTVNNISNSLRTYYAARLEICNGLLKISEKEHIYNQSKLIEYVQHFFSPINYDVVSKLKDNQ